MGFFALLVFSESMFAETIACSGIGVILGLFVWLICDTLSIWLDFESEFGGNMDSVKQNVK